MKTFVENYLKNGFNVIPVNRDKTPACDWKHFQTNKIDNLKLFNSECLAVVCGYISDNLTVLDFDNHQGTAKENLTNFIENPLIKEIYNHYNLPIIKTPSGGFHIYFRSDDVSGNEKLAQIKTSKGIDVIIETRGQGGYVLAPPSPGYELIRNKIEDLQYIENHERIIVLEVARSFNQVNTKLFKPKTDDLTPWNIYDARPESIIEAKQILSNHGWTELGYNNAWCRPGKNKGVSATFGNVDTNVFYVFTSSTMFENQHGYKPSAIKAILEYNSDFSACAKDLAKEFGLKNREQNTQNNIQEKPVIKIEDIWKESEIYIDEVYELPVPIVSIREGNCLFEICTLGNFSAFTGKSKARKSFASWFLQAGCISNSTIQDKFVCHLPAKKEYVLYIDTEQSKAHVARATAGIVTMANVSSLPNFKSFAFRKYSYLDRCKYIEETISKINNLGIVFIDGIADLAFGNNDEEEANRVAQLLMYWTANYDIHINTVIHQTKANDWATGHLGSAIEKKAETVINIKKDGRYSIFEPKQLRNCDDFAPFPFMINSNRIPELITEKTVIDEIIDEEI